jgi:hypothetical protein
MRNKNMSKVKYGLIGFGGIAENRVAKEGYACDKARFAPLKNAELVGAVDINPARKEAAEALGLKWYDSIDAMLADPELQEKTAAQVGKLSLTVAQTEQLVEKLLHSPQKRKQPTFIIKDVRLFLNTLSRGLNIIRSAGVDACCDRQDTEDSICLTIRIPK